MRKKFMGYKPIYKKTIPIFYKVCRRCEDKIRLEPMYVFKHIQYCGMGTTCQHRVYICDKCLPLYLEEYEASDKDEIVLATKAIYRKVEKYNNKKLLSQ